LAEGPAKLMKKFQRNFERNSNSTGMQEFPSTELNRNRIRRMCRMSVSVCRRSIWTSLTNKHFVHQPPPPPSTMPTHPHLLTTITSSPLSCHRHCRQPGAASAHILPHQPAHHERRGNAMSLNERVLATSNHKKKTRRQGATLLTATWQPHNERRQCCRLSLLFIHEGESLAPLRPHRHC
jgi:hypothetical protein